MKYFLSVMAILVSILSADLYAQSDHELSNSKVGEAPYSAFAASRRTRYIDEVAREFQVTLSFQPISLFQSNDQFSRKEGLSNFSFVAPLVEESGYRFSQWSLFGGISSYLLPVEKTIYPENVLTIDELDKNPELNSSFFLGVNYWLIRQRLLDRKDSTVKNKTNPGQSPAKVRNHLLGLVLSILFGEFKVSDNNEIFEWLGSDILIGFATGSCNNDFSITCTYQYRIQQIGLIEHDAELVFGLYHDLDENDINSEGFMISGFVSYTSYYEKSLSGITSHPHTWTFGSEITFHRLLSEVGAIGVINQIGMVVAYQEINNNTQEHDWVIRLVLQLRPEAK